MKTENMPPPVPVDELVAHLVETDGFRSVYRHSLLSPPLRTRAEALLEPAALEPRPIVDELRSSGILGALGVAEEQVESLLERLPDVVTVESLDPATLRGLAQRSVADLVLLAPQSAVPSFALTDHVDVTSSTFEEQQRGNADWRLSTVTLALALCAAAGTAASFDSHVTDALQNAANLFAVFMAVRVVVPRRASTDDDEHDRDDD
jgi:hypothetical protein